MKDYILDLDRPRKLIYDFDAWGLIVQKYAGEAGGEEDFDPSKLKVTPMEVPWLVYIGLRWEDPSLTEDQTKKLLNMAIREKRHTILEMTQTVVNAIFTQAGLKESSITLDLGETKKKKEPQKKGPKPAIPSSKTQEK